MAEVPKPSKSRQVGTPHIKSKYPVLKGDYFSEPASLHLRQKWTMQRASQAAQARPSPQSSSTGSTGPHPKEQECKLYQTSCRRIATGRTYKSRSCNLPISMAVLPLHPE